MTAMFLCISVFAAEPTPTPTAVDYYTLYEQQNYEMWVPVFNSAANMVTSITVLISLPIVGLLSLVTIVCLIIELIRRLKR